MDRNRRRKFGQNFLNNPGIITGILKDLPWQAGDSILEVGPGHGALSGGFLSGGARLTSVEIDPECASVLADKFKDYDYNIVNCDFMDFDLAAYADNNPQAWLVGNLPYNMATPIITSILPHLHKFKGMMIMVQLEAGQRLIAQPSTKEYGFLTVQMACYAKGRILRKVKPENFSPKPNVMSATLLIEALPPEERLDTEMLDVIVGPGFRQRRKKIKNNLKKTFSTEVLEAAFSACQLGDNTRAEELTAQQFAALWTELKKF